VTVAAALDPTDRPARPDIDPTDRPARPDIDPYFYKKS